MGITSDFTFFFVFIILILLSNIEASSDIDALSAFRQRITSDPQNIFSSWDTSLVDPCTWFHITCDQDNRVTRIDAFKYNLSGSLAPELGNLDRLQYLELSGNHLTGTIPQELGKLVNLKSLDLSSNLLAGTIPHSLGNIPNIIFLYLNNNKLGGSIPIELAHIQKLAVLKLNNNNLCGHVPSFNLNKMSVDYSNNPKINRPC